ncbi:PCP reductase family protein [Nitrospina sp. 32_T5]|uniref:PCP reductase family protein n=1 Tax=unclassified Nitrospina TaxID=2638683 RepID=UPI003F9B86C1
MQEDYTAHEKEIEASDRIDHPYADENGVEWTVEAWERVKHAPEFVRPGIRKLMVQRAVKRNYKYITSDFLTEIRNESMMLVSKRVRQFGFEELSMGAFDVAKQKMAESPRKVEVIEEIQDFLALRTEKKEDIVDKFKNYMESAPTSGMPWTQDAMEKMEKVPPFVLGMAKQTIEARARQRGDKMVTPDIIDEVFTNVMPASAKEAMGMEVTEEDKQRDVDYANQQDDEPDFGMQWEDAAKAKVMRIPIPFIREMAIQRIEQEVSKEGAECVTMDLFEKYRFSF